MLLLFFKAILIGLVVAIPIGPIAVLCVQRSLHEGFKIGFMTGLGAALADGTFGLIAGLGLTALYSFLQAEQFWLRLVGGLFLLLVGMKLMLRKPQQDLVAAEDRSSLHALSTSYLLTLSNPATIFAIIAIFAALGMNASIDSWPHVLVLVLGICLGSASIWFGLSFITAFVLHHRISPQIMLGMNRAAGFGIILFGLFSLSLIYGGLSS